MKTETNAALQTIAVAHAARLATANLAHLAAGRRVFVKGKPTRIPFSADVRETGKRLQSSAFEADCYATQAAVVAILDSHGEGRGMGEAAQDATIVEAIAIYCGAGKAEIERLYS